MQDFTSYLQEGLIQNHVVGKLPRYNSHTQVQLQSEFFWEETESSSWDNLNLHLLRKVTAFGIVSLLQGWFSSSSTTHITWGALHSRWRFLGANRPPEAKMSGCRLWIYIWRKKKKLTRCLWLTDNLSLKCCQCQCQMFSLPCYLIMKPRGDSQGKICICTKINLKELLKLANKAQKGSWCSLL